MVGLFFIMENEIWKSVKGYENIYEVSNLGKVKSLDRYVSVLNGKRSCKGVLLKPYISIHGYYCVRLMDAKTKKDKTFRIHQLVAVAFLGHKINGFNKVINHINFNKLDNRSINLEIVSPRENSNKKHIKSTSKYVGVYKRKNRWYAKIFYDGKNHHIGSFIDEHDAHLAYQEKLKEYEARSNKTTKQHFQDCI